MDIMNYILLFVGDLILATFSVFCWNKILKINNPVQYKKNYILIIITAIIINLSSYIFQNPLRIIVVSLMLVLVASSLTNKDFYKSILIVFASQIIAGISEFSFAILGSILLGNKIEKVIENPIIYILMNTYITAISVIIIKSESHNKILHLFYKTIKKEKNKETIKYLFMIIVIMIIATIESYRNVPITIILITNILMIIIFMSIVVKSTLINEKYNNINNKYQTSITSLKEYEAMIDKFRVNTHENKNELLTIRNMIKNKDKNIVGYIDTLVDNKIKDNEKIMYQTSKIPEGGLRATIYSKLCVMDKYKIKYKLNIAKNVRTVDLINIDEELILNICKILGVFTDNAIEAVKTLRKKEINIELYVIKDELFIDITNNFKGNLDLTKMGHERHTTKGEDHGYGLLLVNKIIKENSKHLKNEKSINGNYFTQTLKIKIK